MPTIARDTFSRTVASDWGPTDTGQVWTTFAAGGSILTTDWSVNGAAGVMSVPTTLAYRAAYLPAVVAADVDVAVTVKVNRTPIAGGPVEPGNLILRGTDISTYYLARLQIETTGALTAKLIAPSGAELASTTVVGLTYTGTTQQIRVRAQAIGRVLRMKVWDLAAAEPGLWTLSTTDSTYLGAGWVGVRNGVASGNTNTKPVIFTLDDFTAGTPDMFPLVPLTGTIEFAFGADLKADPSTWVYYDVTTDWQPDRDLAATIGRAAATGKAQPGKLSLWLKNPGGHYTKGNPLSKWWPYVRKNTPIRVTLDPGTGSVRQYTMYTTQWIPRWGSAGASGRQPLVQVVAHGIRRRLTQGETPLRSALYRVISKSDPIAWWTLEDGTDSTQAASGIPGGAPMTVSTGVMDFVDSGPAGSEGCAQPNVTAVNALNATIVGGSATAWQVSVWAKGIRIDPDQGAYFAAAEVRTDNGKIYRLIAQMATVKAGIAQYDTEAQTTATNEIDEPTRLTIDGNWHLFQAALTQSGSNAVVSFWLDGQLVNTATWTGLTIGRPVRVSAIGNFGGIGDNISLNMKEIGIAHIAVHNTATLVNQYQAGLGYAGETAGARIARLCAEQGVAAVVSAGATTTMGPQKPGPFVGLLDEAADVDGGILLDGLGPGFTYITRAAAYNLPVALTVDMAGNQFKAPFEPLDDDSAVVNDQTVNRRDGSSARFIDDDSVGAIERYDDEKTLNTFSDADLQSQAAWRTHLGTAGTDGYRFPGVAADLHTAAGRALIEPWLTSGVRKRVQATHPPSQYGAGPIDLLVEGYTETVRSRRTWTVVTNTSPYDPWRVFTVGQDRVDGKGYQLAVGVSATATTLQVASTTGLLWGTTGDPNSSFPFDINVAGIRLRVTGISGTSSPQTFTVQRSMDGFDKPLPAGAAVRLWTPAAIAL